ncbi:hypothetical protein EDC04DRAFT_3142030 [Pisolithus marmoratus]|nr:hypothetical protein EDC04DRAFT_3142030 [Pisolithus marmoratus]
MSTTSGSHTSSTSTPSPSSSPSPANLTFNAIQNMTTCASASITWNYGGNETYLVLSVTNMGVSQNNSQAFGIQRRQNSSGVTILQTLANVTSQSGSWTWASINLTQGWYEIQGLVGTLTASSSPFHISNGSDTSCLTSASTTPQSPSATPSPVSNLTSSNDKKTGVIVGSVIGALVGVLFIVAFVIWLRRRKTSPTRGGFIVRKVGRWSSLTSNAPSMKHRSNDFTNRHYHGHTDSTSRVDESVTGSRISNTGPPGDSDDLAAETGESERTHSTYSHSPPGMSAFDTFDAPVSHVRHASIHSIHSPASTIDRSRSRTTSVRTSNTALEQQAQRIRSSMEGSMCLRTARLSMPIIAPAAVDRSPTSPIRRISDHPAGSGGASVTRSASTGGSATRRTPRKPVPHYDPSELDDALVGQANDTRSTAPSGEDFSASNSAETMSSRAVSDVSRLPALGPGRPVHYLIPDLPPSLKE